MQKTKDLKKIFKIAADVVLYAFILLCLFSVVLTITAKKSSDGAATIFGQQMRYVQTESMAKNDETYDRISQYEIKDIPIYSMVFIEVVPEDKTDAAAWYDELEVGDVLTFKYVYVRQETITHRLIKKEANGKGGWILTLDGDNKSESTESSVQVIDTSEDPATAHNYVIGKVVGTNYLFGLFITTLKHPAGIVCLIILPALLILFYEVFKVSRLINADKKKKDNEERKQQLDELEELRRRLAELENQKSGESDSKDGE